jgi:site-specific DNA-methyltransferase (adenine-specific)
MKPYYADDLVSLYHGDCREVMSTLDVECDTIVTDPPYASAATTATTGRAKAKWGGNWGDMSLVALMVEATLDAAPLAAGHQVYWFTDHLAYAATVPVMFRRYQNVQSIIWDKQDLGMGARYRKQTEFIVYAWNAGAPEFSSRNSRDLIQRKAVPGLVRVHPAEKPVELLTDLLTGAGGSRILDPYAGSGPTLLAARRLGRPSIGIEIEERNCEIAARRLVQAAEQQDGVLPFEAVQ